MAAELKDKGNYSLVGCTVAPGFEYEDFELGEYNNLISQYETYGPLIKKFVKK